MMTYDEVYANLVDILAARLSVPRGQITPSSHLFGDLGLDSVDLLSAVAVVEREYGIEISDDELARMQVVSDAASVILEHVSALRPQQ